MAAHVFGVTAACMAGMYGLGQIVKKFDQKGQKENQQIQDEYRQEALRFLNHHNDWMFKMGEKGKVYQQSLIVAHNCTFESFIECKEAYDLWKQSSLFKYHTSKSKK